ncbi:hypothetical protein [Erythrobacter aureus]|uniref:hypothetical protein n=1 Tax=Erythrobacter aureus TaxID=2182384 RepID=UPI003A8DDF09
MQRHQSVQSYVPPLIADWIKGLAQTKEVSVSVVVRDLLIAAWNRENDTADRPGGTDPGRQMVFMTVALDALLAAHADTALREKTIAAYHRRLVKLGFIPSPKKEAGHED